MRPRNCWPAAMPCCPPSLSRGDRLAYTQEIYNTNIWRLPLADATRAGGPPERLVSSSRSQRHPAFSPDGRRLAFESTRSGSVEIWACAADGSDPVQLTSFGGPLTGSPQWSPNGAQIVFDSRVTGDSALYSVGPEGGPPRRLETGLGDSSTPAWSPDGGFIYFSASMATTTQIFRRRAQGGPAVQITRLGGGLPASVAGWATRLLCARLRPKRDLVGSADGGDEQPVPGVPPRSSRWQTDWLVSATGIFFLDGDPPRPGIHFLEFASGRTKRVADVTGRPDSWGGGWHCRPTGGACSSRRSTRSRATSC